MAERIYSAGIYARLSVEGNDRKNESIQTQIEIAREYMGKQGDMVLYDCYSDLGKTGTNFEREGFERLMEDVRRRRVDCVIVKDFSRFGRNYIETGNYIQKIFPFLGVRFVSVTDGFDSLFAANDDLGVNLKNLANEMYARDIALKVKSSKRAKRESGSYVGGLPPYGYRAEWVCGKKCLSAEAETAEVVRWIFRQYDEGRSLREIAESLYAQGIHRPTEYRLYRHPRRQPGEALHEWPRSTIKMVLTNSVYAGCAEFGGPGSGNGGAGRPDGGNGGAGRPDGGNGEAGRPNGGNGGAGRSNGRSGEDYARRTGNAGETEDGGPGCGAVKEGIHEAVIDREQFCRVAGRFGKRAGGTGGKDFGENRISQGKVDFGADKFSDMRPEKKDMFDGVLFCGCCGRRLGRRGSAKRSGSGREAMCSSYFCRNADKIDDFRCNTASISKSILTEMVNSAFRQQAALNAIRPERLVEENIKYARQQKAKVRKEMDQLQKKLRAFDWAGSEQYRRYREGSISREAFLEWKAQSGKEAETVKASLEEHRRRMAETEAETERKSTLLRELAAFPAGLVFDRDLLSTLVQRIKLYPDKRVEIIFRFADRGIQNMAEAGGDSGS